jgi:hypothetical protein
MLSYFTIALLLAIPLTARADGIRIAEYTIGIFTYVYLAKLILVDQVKQLPKIKLMTQETFVHSVEIRYKLLFWADIISTGGHEL